MVVQSTIQVDQTTADEAAKLVQAAEGKIGKLVDEAKKKPTFHASLEGAQWGAMSLPEFVVFSKKAGGSGCQPTSYHLFKTPDMDPKQMYTAEEVKAIFEAAEMWCDGFSMHCVQWVGGAADWDPTGCLPFIPGRLRGKDSSTWKTWSDDTVRNTMDIGKELGIGGFPTFAGIHGEPSTCHGYPWSLQSWDGDISKAYNLPAEALDRWATDTESLRNHARANGQMWLYEIHRGTRFMCTRDLNAGIELVDNDPVIGANGEVSHNWEGEQAFTRVHRLVRDYKGFDFEVDLLAGGEKPGWQSEGSWRAQRCLVNAYGGGGLSRCAATHVKQYALRPDEAFAAMIPDWALRPHCFTRVGPGIGAVDMVGFVRNLVATKMPERYRSINKTGAPTVPLVAEAESAVFHGALVSIEAVEFIRDILCMPLNDGSFERGLGAG